ncbi:MAG TPA: hypothetical protein VIK91_25180 [Nannocystis sp.]
MSLLAGAGMLYARPVPGWTSTVIGGAAAGTVLALLRPEAARALLAKEGPVEHASHAVLAAAIVAWGLAGRERGARALPLVMAAFLALVLAEEVDWGAVYGMTAIGERVAGWFGHRNMHNAVHGTSYLLFALPLVGYYLSPGTGSRLGARGPTRDERAAFAAIAGLFLVGNMFAAWEREAQELLELLLYALLLGTGVRLGRVVAGRAG